MIKVVLLGAGNVGFHLTQSFINNSTIKLVQVYNRNIDKIQYLKNKTSITNSLDNLKEADVYLLAVSDNAIENLTNNLIFENKLVVHTSGATSINAIKNTIRKGVFYPLQSFSKNKNINFSEIPLCIEASNEKDLNTLNTLGNAISKNIYIINSEKRKHLHLSAVFVNNFVNHLYYIGNEICENNEVPFEILHPIINETVEKLKGLTPFEAQTGPAKRNDTKSIEAHKEILNLKHKEIYTTLTNSIIKTYGKKL